MRTLFFTFLTIAIHAGLLARMAPEGEFCLRSIVEDCHLAGGGAPDDGCDGDHACPDGDECPADGQHHHHHGTCLHSVPLMFAGEGSPELGPLLVVSLGCEARHSRVPDGPVRDLDKPPLI
jgi:hypothetical protein